jgi:hypothetical protein
MLKEPAFYVIYVIFLILSLQLGVGILKIILLGYFGQ